MTSFVAYFRVSTTRQGRSGLGLDAQRIAVERYTGGRGELIAEYTEVESGRKDGRPQLAAAIDLCRKRKAVLVIAKLDRLARNVAFISNLMESRVEFIAADMPEAQRVTVHLIAAIAEHEREVISKRTKEALAAAKARGVRLGNPRPNPAKATSQAAERAAQFRVAILPLVQSFKAGGRSLRAIAADLNARQVPTLNGGRWHAATVSSILKKSVQTQM
ncbi:recombinase family protein [Methylobacterium nodulans]|uniref:Resolvase domain protein n=1 Tax=Methylobacterium nodulans (strain LMG 21967 / CNCM I-2342 / ORS 2060) TaxID=460265 RepID=B8IY48_METNO|nr:recombinase family protein [Methylobacterium nodulans]ACL63338.1 Resolvase domain protein [Methylobacterium nodulans ORS 2060]